MNILPLLFVISSVFPIARRPIAHEPSDECDSSVLKDTFNTGSWEEFHQLINSHGIYSDDELHVAYENELKKGGATIAIPGLPPLGGGASFETTKKVRDAVKRYREQKIESDADKQAGAFAIAQVSRPDQVAAWLECKRLTLGLHRVLAHNIVFDERNPQEFVLSITFNPSSIDGARVETPRINDIVVDDRLKEQPAKASQTLEAQLRGWPDRGDTNQRRTAFSRFVAASLPAYVRISFNNAADYNILIPAPSVVRLPQVAGIWRGTFTRTAGMPPGQAQQLDAQLTRERSGPWSVGEELSFSFDLRGGRDQDKFHGRFIVKMLEGTSAILQCDKMVPKTDPLPPKGEGFDYRLRLAASAADGSTLLLMVIDRNYGELGDSSTMMTSVVR